MRTTRHIDVFNIVNVLLVSLITLMLAYPFYYMLLYSFNVGTAARTGLYLWPNAFTTENYATLLKSPLILNAYMVTILRTVIGVVTSVLCTGVWAYAMADRTLKNRTFYTVFATIPMFFGGGLVPYYLLIRSLGLIDSFWVYIIPSIYVSWHMILMRTYFQKLDVALEESAKMDGAGDFRIYFSIIFPISMPMIATISLFTAVSQWNAWFDAFIFVNRVSLHPIQLFLKSQIQQSVGMRELMETLARDSLGADELRRLQEITVTNDSLRSAAAVITIGPIVLVYPFLQKYFVKGLTIGSIKG